MQRNLSLLLIYLSAAANSQLCNSDDDELCEGSGDYGSGDYSDDIPTDIKDTREINVESENTSPGAASTVWGILSGKKFLAAVVSGSCIGLLLASMAMCLVLCRARKDNVKRYGYQQGSKSDRTFP